MALSDQSGKEHADIPSGSSNYAPASARGSTGKGKYNPRISVNVVPDSFLQLVAALCDRQPLFPCKVTFRMTNQQKSGAGMMSSQWVCAGAED